MSQHENEERTDAGLGTSHSAQVAERFVNLADTLVSDFDVVELMDSLVETCRELLNTSAAGLLLHDQEGILRVVASSSEETRVLELLQLQNAEGPCLDCVRESRAVTVEDLADARDRWPTFVTAALDVGYRSVHALPLRLRSQTIGSLNLFRSTPPAMTPDEQRIAQAFADVATIGLLQQRALSRASVLASQLQVALDSRIVIEQAKGVLAEHGDLDMATAFAVLRTHARSSNRKLADLADEVVHGRADLTSIVGRAEGVT